MDYKQFHFDTTDYHQAWRLRQQVLRAPQCLQLTEADRQQDALDWHFGVFDGTALVACVSASTLDVHQAKLRQMAVEPSYQGRGLGAALLEFAQAQLYQQGVRDLVLHARTTALDFYQKFGFITSGERFMSVGLNHIVMHKHLD